jgi:hypothetical protein
MSLEFAWDQLSSCFVTLCESDPLRKESARWVYQTCYRLWQECCHPHNTGVLWHDCGSCMLKEFTVLFSLGSARRGRIAFTEPTWSWPFISMLCRGQRMRGPIPPLPQYVFMVWCLVKHTDDFSVPLPLHLRQWIFRMISWTCCR